MKYIIKIKIMINNFINENGTSFIFEPKANMVSVDKYKSNINDIPKNKQIMNSIHKKCKENNKFFKGNFKCISKNPFESVKNVYIGKDLSKYIEEYIFDYNIKINFYIEGILYSKYLNILNRIITENRFDIDWYAIGSPDYRWARDTYEEARSESMLIKQYIETCKNMI